MRYPHSQCHPKQEILEESRTEQFSFLGVLVIFLSKVEKHIYIGSWEILYVYKWKEWKNEDTGQLLH